MSQKNNDNYAFIIIIVTGVILTEVFLGGKISPKGVPLSVGL